MPNTPEHEDFTGYGLIPLADQSAVIFGLTHNSTAYDALDDAEQALFDNLFPNLVQRARLSFIVEFWDVIDCWRHDLIQCACCYLCCWVLSPCGD